MENMVDWLICWDLYSQIDWELWTLIAGKPINQLVNWEGIGDIFNDSVTNIPKLEHRAPITMVRNIRLQLELEGSYEL